MSEPWDHVEAPLLAQADRLDAFREYTQCFFMDALATIWREKGWEEPQYQRRPSIGLRLESGPQEVGRRGKNDIQEISADQY